MTEHSDYPRPMSDPEAEGLPATADDNSTAYGSQPTGPDEAPLPTDRPQGIDRFGTTPGEARRGEPLSQRLAEEEPDVAADDVPADQGLAAEEEVGATGGVEPAGPGAAAEAVGAPGRSDVGESLESPVEPNTDSAVSMYDRPGVDEHVGRLVAPDQGAGTDAEPDEVATDAGAAGGGPSAEEAAIHEEPQA